MALLVYIVPVPYQLISAWLASVPMTLPACATSSWHMGSGDCRLARSTGCLWVNKPQREYIQRMEEDTNVCAWHAPMCPTTTLPTWLVAILPWFQWSWLWATCGLMESFPTKNGVGYGHHLSTMHTCGYGVSTAPAWIWLSPVMPQLPADPWFCSGVCFLLESNRQYVLK
jgi:hypothetical protein